MRWFRCLLLNRIERCFTYLNSQSQMQYVFGACSKTKLFRITVTKIILTDLSLICLRVRCLKVLSKCLFGLLALFLSFMRILPICDRNIFLNRAVFSLVSFLLFFLHFCIKIDINKWTNVSHIFRFIFETIWFFWRINRIICMKLLGAKYGSIYT